MPIGPGQVLEALRAVIAAGIERRDQFYWAMRATLVTAPEQFRLFDQAFHLYFRNPRLAERLMALVLPSVAVSAGNKKGDPAIRRLLEAPCRASARAGRAKSADRDRSIWVLLAPGVIAVQGFRTDESVRAGRGTPTAARKMLWCEALQTRRFRSHPLGERYDLRRTMQVMLRNNGQIVQLARKRPRRRPPVLALLCDISGSMSAYSRLFLHFAHILSAGPQTVHSFVFGTRLSNISRRLADPDVDKALAQVSRDVADFDGGTRIADSLQRFM